LRRFYASILFLETDLDFYAFSEYKYYLYVRVGILLTCGKHLHDRIFSLKGEVGTHKTSLAPLFIEVPSPNKKSERSCVYILEITILPFYDISIGFWECSDSLEMF
jgi:selenocysteine lyase/cysteine desulfurase